MTIRRHRAFNRVDARTRERSWFTFRNAAGEGGLPAELWIYDEIGFWGVTASQFTDELRGVTASNIELRLNSPGGEVFDGIAIYNALQRHPAEIVVHVDALAASAASFIAMAGDRVIIDRHAQMMIHDAAGFMFGNAADARKLADELERVSDTIANIYAERTEVDAAFWRMAMVDETWYSAQEAVDAGLADEVRQPASRVVKNRVPAGVPANTAWDLSVYNYAGRQAAPAPRIPERAPATGDPNWRVDMAGPLASLLHPKVHTASTVDDVDPLAVLKGA